MLAPPPRSPVFPYTTLFRSRVARVDRRVGLQEVGMNRCARDFTALVADDAGCHGARETKRLADRQHPVADLERDRKSTRLNSSHVEISYAVFCLKKKTTSTS